MSCLDKEFIPYEQSLELKELGFDEECLGYYIIEEEQLMLYEVENKNLIDAFVAPLYQQAFRWFREKKLLGEIRPVDDWNSWSFQISAEDLMSPFYIAFISNDEYKTYEEAELACIKKLIEIVKQ